MKIILVQFTTNNVPYSKFTKDINKKYCEKYDYEYFIEEDTKKIIDKLEGRSITWYKPHLIKQILLDNPDCDYVVFLDIDAVVTNHSKKIESFLNQDFSIIMTKDYGPSLVNAGVMFVKNDNFSIKYMDDWWSICEEFPQYKTGLWHDQTCIGLLYERLSDKEKFVIVDNTELNSRYYNNNEFIFHAFSYGNLRNRTIDAVYYDIFNIEPMVDKTSLRELGEIYPTDKHHQHNYFDQVYQNVFHPIKDDVKLLLEIGVLDGNSLKVFKRFFQNSKIIGVDLKEGIIDDNIEIIKCDQSLREDLLSLSNRITDIDIILDDGSHKMYDQQITFSTLFKNLKSGGLYIIEDLHTSLECLRPEKAVFQWGDPSKTTTLQMLELYQTEKKVYSDYLNDDELTYLTENIESCEIYYLNGNNSITSVIKKK